MHSLTFVVSGLSALFALVLVLTYLRHRTRIARFASAATEGARTTEDAVFQLGRKLFSSVNRRPNPIFLIRLFSPLGPSPTAVLEGGGCCSGINRLFIVSLDTLGIRAGQITVYRSPGPVAVHCLAQVTIESRPLIIDVDYGVFYKHPDGGPIDIAALRAGVQPVIESFICDEQARRIEGNFCTRPGYPGGWYFNFDFRCTRTANWTMSRIRKVSYKVLSWVTSGRVDCYLLPPIWEWPEVSLAVGLVISNLLLWAVMSAAIGNAF